jgi:drug/metabolite transporter (DMT)-like permease
MLGWIYLIIISAITVGVAAIIEKQTLKREYATAYSTAFAFLIAILSIVFIPFAKFNLSALSIMLIYAFSLISTITYLVTARILRHSSISASSPILSVLPTVFIVIMAFFFLGEKLTILQYVSIFVLVIVSYVMFFMLPQNGKKLEKKERNKYLYILVITSVLMGIGSIINKYALGTVDPFTFIILTELFIAVNFIIIITVRYNGVREMLASLKHHKLPIASIAILTTISRITYYIALSTSAVALAQPLNNAIYMVVTVFAGIIIFNEGSVKKKLLLSAIILIFAFILVL